MTDNGSKSRSASPASATSEDSATPALPMGTSEPASNTEQASSPNKKRTASVSDLNGGPKVTKRRAARACVSCRQRKVRCDVVEGSPCGNCRWDNVKCEVQESRRRKKNNTWPSFSHSVGVAPGGEGLRAKGFTGPLGIIDPRQHAGRLSSIGSLDGTGNGGTYSSPLEGPFYGQNAAYPNVVPAMLSGVWPNAVPNPLPNQVPNFVVPQYQPIAQQREPDHFRQLPAFIRPLPAKIEDDDAKFLHTKGALTLPSRAQQGALVKAYLEYVHPYMPLIEFTDFLKVINDPTGKHGQISLFLYQAILFVATAFVDESVLTEAGFHNRKAARKQFFQKARLLYDFDYETDRLILVQALLLMTYWYETPDDQKDTWHWMGVAISLAHTIGLHRNPATTSMDPRKQKLWKRIWWSCFMRDRLIALGMRRPTRIKDEDFDVPMLEISDFEIEVLPEEIQILGSDCVLIRNTEMQQQLAVMCIEKAKLCISISNMLKAQYSVLSRDGMPPEETTNSTMMLLPNKSNGNLDEVDKVDKELERWYKGLPECCKYRPPPLAHILSKEDGEATLLVHRNLLHMVYHTTISALHRPRFLPTKASTKEIPVEAQDRSRMQVRDAASRITQMAAELRRHNLEKYLPTTGVTVILPAMIIHLLDMKSHNPDARERAKRGYEACKDVMGKLRNTYAAADFATGFMDAAYAKAKIDAPVPVQLVYQMQMQQHLQQQQQQQQQQNAKAIMKAMSTGHIAVPVQAAGEKPSTPPPDNAPYLNATEVSLYHQDRTYLPRDAAGNPVVGTHSPPDTDQDSPMALSEKESPTAHMTDAQVGVGQQDDTDWVNNVSAANNFDYDQWLEFPAEGVTDSDQTFMGKFDAYESLEQHSGQQAGLGTDAIDWMGSQPQQQEQQQQQQHQLQSQLQPQIQMDMFGLSTGSAA